MREAATEAATAIEVAIATETASGNESSERYREAATEAAIAAEAAIAIEAASGIERRRAVLRRSERCVGSNRGSFGNSTRPCQRRHRNPNFLRHTSMQLLI